MKKQIVKTVGNKEYFYDPDGRLVYRFKDETIGYRDNELLPEILAKLNQAREEGRQPNKKFIDSLINIQAESPTKAYRYIQYKLLGEVSYSAVFGDKALEEYEKENAKKENASLRDQVNDLEQKINLLLLMQQETLNKLNKLAEKQHIY